MMSTPADAQKWTLVALLSSPHFLYRIELGEKSSDGSFVLSGEEIAGELAYTFTGGPPSEDLLDRARKGELDDAAARSAEARRLLDTPRGHATVEEFMRRWLRYDDVRNLAKDDSVVASFATLRTDMAEETRRFLEDLVFAKKGTVRDLFTSSDTFLTAALAQHYGLPAPTAPFARVTRPPEQSLGILSQGAVLSRYALTHSSSPPQRGAFVRRRLLCQVLPSPPPNAGTPPLPQPGMTTRELYENLHSTGSSCAGCHKMIDPIGFGLEAFDTAGRFRTSEQGKPIHADGAIYNTASGDQPFTDGRDLANKLASSAEVSRCIGGLAASYAFGAVSARQYTTTATLENAQSSLYDFVAALASAPHFAARAP
jgi:hypothetical protein